MIRGAGATAGPTGVGAGIDAEAVVREALQPIKASAGSKQARAHLNRNHSMGG